MGTFPKIFLFCSCPLFRRVPRPVPPVPRLRERGPVRVRSVRGHPAQARLQGGQPAPRAGDLPGQVRPRGDALRGVQGDQTAQGRRGEDAKFKMKRGFLNEISFLKS